jgi:hypothetical protein
MSKRHPSGFISAFYDPLKNPGAPTIGTATGGDASASVAFTAPANVGGSAISEYYAISDPGRVTASAASSPISVTGLTNGTAYTFAVWALNTYGPSAFSAASGSVTPQSQRGVFAGGRNTSNSTPYSTTQYINIPTTGNAVNFGSLSQARYSFAGVGSSTRGVFAGGFRLTNGDPTFYGTMDYITIASDGNATGFGASITSRQALGSCGNETRGIFAGGADYNRFSQMDYITIATTGAVSTFGQLVAVTNRLAGCASSTRGVLGGGFDPNGSTNVIQYITIASTGNATDFGDLVAKTLDLGACSSSTRGIFAGGEASGRTNVIQFVTIASTGNASDFGDLLTGGADLLTGVSSQTRGVFAGNASNTNVIQYITIASTGNAIDFGDLVSINEDMAGCSNCHGGL